MAMPLYLLIELSFFLLSLHRLHQIFHDAESFSLQQKTFHQEERKTLQLAGMHAVQKNLDQARLFFCETKPKICAALTQRHHTLLLPLQQVIATYEGEKPPPLLEAVLRKQSPRLRPATWPNWVPGLRYHTVEATP